jgi:hypothetical protein
VLSRLDQTRLDGVAKHRADRGLRCEPRRSGARARVARVDGRGETSTAAGTSAPVEPILSATDLEAITAANRATLARDRVCSPVATKMVPITSKGSPGRALTSILVVLRRDSRRPILCQGACPPEGRPRRRDGGADANRRGRIYQRSRRARTALNPQGVFLMTVSTKAVGNDCGASTAHSGCATPRPRAARSGPCVCVKCVARAGYAVRRFSGQAVCLDDGRKDAIDCAWRATSSSRRGPDAAGGARRGADRGRGELDDRAGPRSHGTDE